MSRAGAERWRSARADPQITQITQIKKEEGKDKEAV